MSAEQPERGALRTSLAARRRPDEPVWWDRGFLPHVESSQLLQHVCYRLADSLPEPVVQQMEDELKSLRQPTLLIHGRDDRVIPLATSSIPMMNLIPDVELHVFGGCGHWTMIERAPQFVTLVSDFLDR